MSKPLYSLLITLLAAFALALPASAQTAPPANTAQTPPAKPAPSTSAGQTPVAKPPAAKTGTAAAKPAPLPLKTPKDKASYAIGMSMAKGMKAQGVDIDPAILARGLRDALAGKPQLTEEQAQSALTELQAD